jgi:hypothetical protein
MHVPLISFDSKGTVVVTKQFKTQYTGTFDLKPISELLEKARPPESREQKTTTEAKRQWLCTAAEAITRILLPLNQDALGA